VCSTNRILSYYYIQCKNEMQNIRVNYCKDKRMCCTIGNNEFPCSCTFIKESMYYDTISMYYDTISMYYDTISMYYDTIIHAGHHF
jgi:hypothetical protein